MNVKLTFTRANGYEFTDNGEAADVQEALDKFQNEIAHAIWINPQLSAEQRYKKLTLKKGQKVLAKFSLTTDI